MRAMTALKAGTAIALPFAMAACSSGNNTTATPPPATPPAASLQSQFGTSFAATYDTSNTTEAKEPAPTDVPALSNSTNPIEG